MPIEIKELIIRATVEDQAERVQNEQQGTAEERAQLVEECVEQVLFILQREKER